VTTSNPYNEGRTLAASAANSRTHTVKSGDTPTTIARKYSVKVEALMAANPKLDARRMRVGQVVAVPSS
jgi:N-acetylmuramoyl-L-alanine amidase